MADEDDEHVITSEYVTGDPFGTLRIRELEAENERLREALLKIGGPAGTVVTTLADADAIARDALTGELDGLEDTDAT